MVRNMRKNKTIECRINLCQKAGAILAECGKGANCEDSRPCYSDRSERLRRARDALDEHVKKLAMEMEQGQSENLKRYLRVCASFHQYSFGNILLALGQRPNMTRIAGIKTWNKLGRKVRPGERGIMILAPVTIKQKSMALENRDGSESQESPQNRTFTLFKTVHVFDLAQTSGKQLPEIITATGDASMHLPALREAVRQSGINLEYDSQVPGSPGAKGASYNGKIILRKDLAPADEFRALVHELAHENLHWNETKEDHVVEETEADATAYVVCTHYGINCDTSDYLLLHHSDPTILLQRLERIRRTASKIITAIEKDNPETADQPERIAATVS